VPTFAPVQVQVDEAAWLSRIRCRFPRTVSSQPNRAASLRRARELGVLIIAGSDAGSCGVAHALGFYYELELMERAGLRPLDVINAATGTSAGRLGFREDFGRVAPGCLSRLIVTRHSPAKTVANLRQPGTVVFDGAVLPLGGEPAGL
jgi:imidazolonepropionase-like amidohydrolase